MTTRTADFTAADGTTWPLSSGSWTHTTDTATISSPTHVVNTNRGRARVAAATTAASRRAHHADYTNFKENSVEVRVLIYSITDTTSAPGVMLKTSGTTAGANRYTAKVHDAGVGKAYLTIEKFDGGTVTGLVQSAASTVIEAQLPGGTLNLAFRAIQLSSSVVLQAKTWTGTEPDWTSTEAHTSTYSTVGVTDSSTGVWDTDGGVGLLEHFWTDPTTQHDVIYDDFSATNIDVILANYISPTSTVFSPGPYQVVAPDYLASTATVFAPGITQHVAPDYLASTVTVFAPAVSSSASVAVPAWTPATTIYEPGAADTTQTVTVPAWAASTVLYQPGAVLVSSAKGTMTVTDALAGTVTAADARVGTVAAADTGIGTMTVSDE